MERAALERWIRSRRDAAERERQESSARPPSDSIRAGLALIRLGARFQGWPAPEDPVSRREDLDGYASWARLRAALRER
jgi:hypothetical protein